MAQRKSKGKPKQLAAPSPPDRKEVPRLGPLHPFEDRPGGKHPKWRLSLLDLDHTESWASPLDATALTQIKVFLCEMERLTWTEIRAQMFNSKRASHRKHHPTPVETLCDEAQRRLRVLKLDDFDELFRFRLGNMPRLWGILDGDIFYPVWWDPDHEVYPTDPS